MLEPGRIFYGPRNERRRITDVAAGIVHFEEALSGTPGQAPLADFDEWRLQSNRRIYYPENYEERRVRLEFGEETVLYMDAETGERTSVSRAEWDTWRNDLNEGEGT